MTPAQRRNARRVLAVLTRLLDQKRDADFVRGVATLNRVSGAVDIQVAAVGAVFGLTPNPGRTTHRRPYVLPAPWEDIGTSELVTAGGITGEWHIPNTIRRAGAVVTVPGNQPSPTRYRLLVDFTRAIAAHLGVAALAWDYDPNDGDAYVDLDFGIDLAWTRFGKPLLVSHSFGGVHAAALAVGSDAGPDVSPSAFVAVSSVLSLDDLGEPYQSTCRVAGTDPRAFRYRIPVSVITGSADPVGGCSPADAREFAAAYRIFGGQVNEWVIEGAGHNDTLLDLTTIEEIGRRLG